MHYSISSERKRQRFLFDNNIEADYLDWQINSDLYNEFKTYKDSYIIKNDIVISGVSYFHSLSEYFEYKNLSLKEFVNSFNYIKFYDELNDILYNKKYYEYAELGFEQDEIFTKATKDIENLHIYLDEINEKNALILEEFKSFILAFPQYLQTKYARDYRGFKYVYNILSEDIKFFKKTKVQSLDKYKFLIGSYLEKHIESRGRTNDFIPAGICDYGRHVFINSEDFDKNKFGLLWYKKSLRQTFYHEVGHALDYLYYNDSLLKGKEKQQRSSHNSDLLKCSILNYRKFKQLSPKLHKQTIEWVSYYCHPKIIKPTKIFVPPKTEKQPKDILSEKISNDVFNLFNEFGKTSNLTLKNPVNTTKKFKPIVSNNKYDYSRVLDETWAECFAFLFDWIKNGFCEYDRYIINSGNSNDRTFIKIHYKSFMYILNNFDWEKLNISYSLFLRRRVQIKKLLNYVNDMPLNLKKTSALEIRRKKYLKFNDILKG